MGEAHAQIKAFCISQASTISELPQHIPKNIGLNKVPLGERIRDKINNHLLNNSF